MKCFDLDRQVARIHKKLPHRTIDEIRKSVLKFRHADNSEESVLQELMIDNEKDNPTSSKVQKIHTLPALDKSDINSEAQNQNLAITDTGSRTKSLKKKMKTIPKDTLLEDTLKLMEAFPDKDFDIIHSKLKDKSGDINRFEMVFRELIEVNDGENSENKTVKINENKPKICDGGSVDLNAFNSPKANGSKISNASGTSDSKLSLPKAQKRSHENAFSDSAPSTSKNCSQVPQQQTSPAIGLPLISSTNSLQSSTKTDSKVKLHSNIFQISNKLVVRES